MIDDPRILEQEPGLFASISSEKRWLLFVYFPVTLLLHLVIGITLDHYQPGAGKAGDFVFGIAANVIIYIWCRLDSDERRYELHRLFRYAVVILGVLALLYYLFRSRGSVGGLRLLAGLVVYIVCCYVIVTIIALFIFLILIATGLVSPNVIS